jgi:ketosteroid isomerase-like protein
MWRRRRLSESMRNEKKQMTIESSLRLLNDYHDAWERGDRDAGLAFYADDMIVHMGGSSPLGGDYRGRESFVRDWVERVAAYTDTWDVADQDVLLVGDDGILVLVRVIWSKGDRRVEVDRLAFYKLADGQIVESWFSDMNQAEVGAFFDGIA